jgi:hypothetical protein
VSDGVHAQFVLLVAKIVIQGDADSCEMLSQICWMTPFIPLPTLKAQDFLPVPASFPS